jgi:polygalacturonase
VPIPIAISPYYNNQTTEGFVDPGIKGTRIPEYKNITLENITDETPGDVLIAGYDQDHRTQVNLIDVTIKGITLDKMHLKLADIGNGGTNLPLDQAAAGNDVKITALPGKPAKPYSCEGKFLPMR